MSHRSGTGESRAHPVITHIIIHACTKGMGYYVPTLLFFLCDRYVISLKSEREGAHAYLT